MEEDSELDASVDDTITEDEDSVLEMGFEEAADDDKDEDEDSGVMVEDPAVEVASIAEAAVEKT